MSITWVSIFDKHLHRSLSFEIVDYTPSPSKPHSIWISQNFKFYLIPQYTNVCNVKYFLRFSTVLLYNKLNSSWSLSPELVYFWAVNHVCVQNNYDSNVRINRLYYFHSHCFQGLLHWQLQKVSLLLLQWIVQTKTK